MHPQLLLLVKTGDAGRLRQAVDKTYEVVSYCYGDNLDQPPVKPDILRLLRLSKPPSTTNEAIDGILKVCMDLGDLCDPEFATKVAVVTKPR